MATVCFILGLLLCMNEGEWFPFVNAVGLGLVLYAAMKWRKSHEV